MTTKRREAHILLVEDDRVYADLIREALKDSNLPHRLDLATDGDEALDLLPRLLPHLVLLDLNLPRKSGLEVLQEMQMDPALKSIPVIVMTNSRSQDDVVRCYEHNCNAYIRKPLGFEGLLHTFSTTGKFWFNVAELPRSVPISGDWSLPPASLKKKAQKKKRATKKTTKKKG